MVYLQERLKQIEVFQAKADRELVELTNSFEHGQFGSIGQLEQLIRTGENLDVEIAQLAELKNVSGRTSFTWSCHQAWLCNARS